MANTTIEEDICQAIEYIVNHAVENARFDKTIQATIIDVIDATIGKYKVRYQDSSLIAYAQSTDVTYTRGSDVYVLVPANDMTRDKTILGTTKKLGNNYATNIEDEEAFEIVGNNCLTAAEFSLSSYSSDMIKPIYDKNNPTNNLVDIDIIGLETYLKQSSTIICGANFRTNLPLEQQLIHGNYGIIFELNFKDNATEKINTKNYVIDINQMKDNPYKLVYWTKQYGIFRIDGENFDSINKISLFVTNFNKVENKPADIFIKDLELCGANPLSAEAIASTALTFITPKGIYFDNNDLDSATVEIQAQIRVKGKVVDKNSQQISYYWFVEHAGITTQSKEFNRLGGQGWKCLNDYNVVNADETQIEWVPGNYNYIVSKERTLARETKYKCVTVLDTLILSKEITIINYDSEYNITIESDSGTQFFNDIGTPSLTCKVNGEEKLTGDYTYTWAKVDNNENFFSLSDTVNENQDYNEAVVKKEVLEMKLAAEQALPNQSQEKMNEYLTIIKNYDTIMRVERNKLHKIQISSITNFSKYKCSVFYLGTFLGTASITIVNRNKNIDEEEDNNYTLVLRNGVQMFKYNEEGISPTSNSVVNPYVIQPLSFAIYNSLGETLPEDVLAQCDIKWVIPTSNTLIKIPSDFDKKEEKNKEIIDETQIAYYNVLSLPYTIASRYMVSKTNNNIQLEVKYKDNWLITKTNFAFAKEGDPGTNGTEFLCQLLPNPDLDAETILYPMILNGKLNYKCTSNKWLKVQFWHNGDIIYTGTENGISEEGKSVDITWTILKNKHSRDEYDNTDLSINEDTGEVTYLGYQVNGDMPANIIKCQIRYDNVEYYATMPIITAVTKDSNYEIKLKDNTGFRFATYAADGRRPQYDNSAPFELIVNQIIDGVQEEISLLKGGENSAYNDYVCLYDWNILGKIYNQVTKEYDENINLGLVRKIDDYNTNSINIKPLDNYTGECINNGLECVVTQKDVQIAKIHIPIHLLLNKYGHAALNGWDGNHISIDKDGNGVILAPQIGAGKKEKKDNTFTGLLMGQVKEAGQSTADVGLIGYYHGERTLHIDSEGGYAIFGKNGPGQIVLDPGNNQGMIYSNDFWKSYYSDNTGDTAKNGLPITNYNYSDITYKYDGQNEEGMLIDLTTPRIVFGSGNFKVDPNGYITARGGGSIAGWNIDDENIYSNKSKTDGRLTLNSTNQGKIYSHNHDTLNKTSIGFYLSYDGLSLGSKIKITNDGVVTVGQGAVAGTGKHWTISGDSSNSYIKYGNSDTDKVYIGTDQISLGNKFSVNSAGQIISKSGIIGGWTITDTTLTGGNITIKGNGNGNENGNIDCTGGCGWYIHSDGSAKFGNFSIDQNGNITANGGNFNNVIISGTVTATSGQFDNCIIGGSCTIGGQRVDGAFVKNANIVNGAVTTGKIADAAITNAKIANATITSAKIKSLSADKISGGTISGEVLNGVDASFGKIGASGINTQTISSDAFALNTEYGSITIGSDKGQNFEDYIMTDVSLSLSGRNQGLDGIIVESGNLKIERKKLTFKKGILVAIGMEQIISKDIGISS